MSDWSSGIDAAGEVYSTQAGEPGWINDAAETVVRAFLSVQPSVRWCSVHSCSAFKDSGSCAYVSDFYWPNAPCRVVERKLVDAPHIG